MVMLDHDSHKNGDWTQGHIISPDRALVTTTSTSEISQNQFLY